MIREEIRTKLSAFIKQNYLFDERKEIDPSVSFLGTGILDSTGILELISFIEEEFSVSFLDEELTSENFDSVERVAAMLERKSKNGTKSQSTPAG